MTYHPKSYALAMAFLADYKDGQLKHGDRKEAEDELAQEIQKVIEGWLCENTIPF